MPKTRVWAEVSEGLRRVVEERARREGLNISIVVRRAIMESLKVDADGEPR